MALMKVRVGFGGRTHKILDLVCGACTIHCTAQQHSSATASRAQIKSPPLQPVSEIIHGTFSAREINVNHIVSCVSVGQVSEVPHPPQTLQ